MTQRERLPRAVRAQIVLEARTTVEACGYIVRKTSGPRECYTVRKDAMVCRLGPDDLVFLATKLTQFAV